MTFRIAHFSAVALLAAALLAPAAARAADPAAADAATTEPVTEMVDCIALPKGEVSDEELSRLVPDDLPGRVFIRWRTETQEDNYGFNIYRADKPDGAYRRVNRSIIPGEGSTNVPKEYCFMETGLPRGSVWYYKIESVDTMGKREVLEGTLNTRVQVKTVEEERAWIRRRAMPPPDDAAPTTATAAAPTAPATTPQPATPATPKDAKEDAGKAANPLL